MYHKRRFLGTTASGRYGLKKNLPGSRQFKDFEAYLLGRERFAKLQDAQALPVAIEINSDGYLQARLALLQEKLHQVDRLAGQGELPDAEITGELLKVSPLKKAVPEEAEQLEEEAFALMPHLKITELLLEVYQRTDFTRHLYAPQERPVGPRSLDVTNRNLGGCDQPGFGKDG